MAAVQVWAAYSPVKNSPPDAKAKAAAGSPSHSATTGELDIYQTNCRCSDTLALLFMNVLCTMLPAALPYSTTKIIVGSGAC